MGIITDPKKIKLMQYKTIAAGLKIEINTPLRHSHNAVFKRAKQITGERGRKKCFAKLIDLITEMEYEINNAVAV